MHHSFRPPYRSQVISCLLLFRFGKNSARSAAIVVPLVLELYIFFVDYTGSLMQGSILDNWGDNRGIIPLL
jgi:hypothetical protein